MAGDTSIFSPFSILAVRLRAQTWTDSMPGPSGTGCLFLSYSRHPSYIRLAVSVSYKESYRTLFFVLPLLPLPLCRSRQRYRCAYSHSFTRAHRPA